MKRRLVALLLFLCLLGTLVPSTVADTTLPAQGQCGVNVFWNSESITGTGPMYDNVTFFAGKELPQTIYIDKGVTTIGGGTFAHTTGVKYVEMPDTLVSIGKNAFAWCLSLRVLTIPASVTFIDSTAFTNADNLSAVFFLGNAPLIASPKQLFASCAYNVMVFKTEGATGFDTPAWDSIRPENRTPGKSWAGNSYCEKEGAAPCCSEGGLEVELEACSSSMGDTLPPTGHKMGQTPTVVEASCTADGSSYVSCELCGQKEVTVLPALGHDFVSGVCSRCGTLEGQESLAHEHSWALQGEVFPTCTQGGYTGDTVCEACGAMKQSGSSVADSCPTAILYDTLCYAWYHECVDYVINHRLMAGTGAHTFSPGAATTRAMLTTVLYRMAGSPQMQQASSFADVPQNSWYADAVAWAQQEGLVVGYEDRTFGPNDTLSREQLVTLFYRYAGYCGMDLQETADLKGFSDSWRVHDYARNAFSWAVGSGLVYGISGKLVPAGGAQRSQMASVLMRFCQLQDGTLVLIEPTPPAAPVKHAPGWSCENRSWYYYDANGKPVTGKQTIGSYSYTFGANGVWQCANYSDLKTLLNAQPLNPERSGILELDSLVDTIFAKIMKPGYTTYDKVKAIYDYCITHFTYEQHSIVADYVYEFGGSTIYANANDLCYCYEACVALTFNVGVCDHYAAAFMVLTRALGLDTYVMNGKINKNGHAWNHVKLGNTYYVFDMQADDSVSSGSYISYYRFGKKSSTLKEYTYAGEAQQHEMQRGFVLPRPLTVLLTLTDNNGTHKQLFTHHWYLSHYWFSPYCEWVIIHAKGDVTYTLEVVSGGEQLYLDNGDEAVRKNVPDGTKVYGTITAGGTAIISAYDASNGREVYLDLRSWR